MRKFWLLLLFPLLTSCGMATGFFNSEENGPYGSQDIIQYLRKQQIQRSEIYSFSQTAYTSTTLRLKKGIPEAEIFNQKGEALIWPKARFSLAKRMESLLKSYPEKLPAIDSKKPRQLQGIFEQLYDISGRKSQPDAQENYDLHLVIYFSLNSGLSGDEMLKYCHDLLQNNPKTRMKVYFVNMDQQLWWRSKIKPEIAVEELPLSP